MKIAYITAHTPYGTGETFILEELNTILQLDVDVIIIPRNPPKKVFHSIARNLLEKTIWLPLINTAITMFFLKACFRQMVVFRIVKNIFKHSRSIQMIIKNLAVLPKAVYISQRLMKENIQHIHVHWGSTTATMAWIISELTGIPWSMTLHRWDIMENNMLKLKVEKAAFTRCISQKGREEVLEITAGEYEERVKVLHMGVKLPYSIASEVYPSNQVFTIACPANLLPVKGHRYLINALKLLKDKGVEDFRCLVIGDGPLEEKIKQDITRYHLQDKIVMRGRIPHDELLGMYEKGDVHAVVLPSIVDESGEKEGIPVALMEAMAYGIPVVSTKTGGIPELLLDGAGLLVNEKDSEELANALYKLKSDICLYQSLQKKGYERISGSFNSEIIAKKLVELMRANCDV